MLIINSFGADFAPFSTFHAEFRQQLIRQYRGPLEIHEFYLESARGNSPHADMAEIDYLRARFEAGKPDLIVNIGGPAVQFYARNRAQLFPDTPMLVGAASMQVLKTLDLKHDFGAVVEQVDPGPVLDEALRVLPGVTNVAVVLGHSPLELFWMQQLQEATRPYTNRLHFEYFCPLTFQQMLDRAARLPPRSVLLYAMLLVDKAGVSREGNDSFDAIYAAANAPILGTRSSQLGRGILGGAMFPFHDEAQTAAEMSSALLNGDAARGFRMVAFKQGPSQYDWRELQRWHVSESRLPPGSIILFKPPTLWQAHPGFVLAAFIAVLLETVLIGALLLERRHRRTAEFQERERAEQLRRLGDNLPSGMVYQVAIEPGGKRRFLHLSAGIEKLHGIQAALATANPELLYSQIPPEDRQRLADAETESLRSLKPLKFETRVRRPDGEIRWILLNSAPRRQANGVVVWDGNELDITERKQAEEILRSGEQRARDIINAAPFGAHIYQLQPGNRLVFIGANESASRILNVNHQLFLGKTIEEAFPALAGTPIPEAYRRVARTGEPFHQEQLDYNEQGISGAFTIDSLRIEPSTIAVFFHDITVHRRAEEALRRSEIRFRTLVENAAEAVFVQTDYKFAYVNSAALRLFAAESPDQLVGKPILERLAPEFRQEVQDRMQRLNAEKVALPMTQVTYLRLDGSTVPVEVSAAPIEYEGRSGSVVYARNITERRSAEAALRESAERLLHVQRIAQLGTYTLDARTGLWTSSRLLDEIFGIADELFVKDVSGWTQIIHPDDRVRMLQHFQDHVLGHLQPFDQEYRILRLNDREERWVHGRGELVLDTQGRPTQMIGTIQDITERKRAEDELRQSQQRFQILTEASFEGICISDSGRVLDANDQLVSMLGYSREELAGREILTFVAPEFRSQIAERIRSGQGSLFEHRALRKDGSQIDVQVQAKMIPWGGRTVRVTAMQNITFRKQAEQAMRESEEKFAKAFRASPDGMSISELESSRFIEVNDGYCRLFGYRREEMLGHTAIELGIWHSPDHREPFVDELRTRGSVHDFIVHTRSRNDTPIILLVSAELIDLQNVRCLVSVLHDITARVQTEEALRAREAQLDSIFRAAPVGIGMLRNRIIIEVNEAFCRMSGYDRHELLGRSTRLFYESDADFDLVGQRTLDSVTQGKTTHLELAWKRKDGATIDGLLCLAPILQDGVAAQMTFVVMDITELRRAERAQAETRVRAERAREDFTRRLIGSQEAERRRIAGELHDSLGQNLLLVKNRAQLALASSQDPTEVRRQIEFMNTLAAEAIAEVRRISRDLRPYQLDQLGLTRALEVMIDNAAESSGMRFDFKIEPVDDVFNPEASTNLYRVVQESLNNILKHSRARHVTLQLERDLHHVRLWIEDDGVGFNIPATRPLPAGGGLGLDNIAERIRILGGTLKLDSQPSRGTRIEALLPLASEAA
ncbi:MAG: PAS domain S-box protein [Verrucomicrobiota bacterium]